MPANKKRRHRRAQGASARRITPADPPRIVMAGMKMPGGVVLEVARSLDRISVNNFAAAGRGIYRSIHGGPPGTNVKPPLRLPWPREHPWRPSRGCKYKYMVPSPDFSYIAVIFGRDDIRHLELWHQHAGEITLSSWHRWHQYDDRAARFGIKHMPRFSPNGRLLMMPITERIIDDEDGAFFTVGVRTFALPVHQGRSGGTVVENDHIVFSLYDEDDRDILSYGFVSNVSIAILTYLQDGVQIWEIKEKGNGVRLKYSHTIMVADCSEFIYKNEEFYDIDGRICAEVSCWNSPNETSCHVLLRSCKGVVMTRERRSGIAQYHRGPQHNLYKDAAISPNGELVLFWDHPGLTGEHRCCSIGVYTYDTEPGVGWSEQRIYFMYGCNAGSISYFSPDGSCVVVSGYSHPQGRREEECHVVRLEDASLLPGGRFFSTYELPWDSRPWADYTIKHDIPLPSLQLPRITPTDPAPIVMAGMKIPGDVVLEIAKGLNRTSVNNFVTAGRGIYHAIHGGPLGTKVKPPLRLPWPFELPWLSGDDGYEYKYTVPSPDFSYMAIVSNSGGAHDLQLWHQHGGFIESYGWTQMHDYFDTEHRPRFSPNGRLLIMPITKCRKDGESDTFVTTGIRTLVLPVYQAKSGKTVAMNKHVMFSRYDAEGRSVSAYDFVSNDSIAVLSCLTNGVQIWTIKEKGNGVRLKYSHAIMVEDCDELKQRDGSRCAELSCWLSPKEASFHVLLRSADGFVMAYENKTKSTRYLCEPQTDLYKGAAVSSNGDLVLLWDHPGLTGCHRCCSVGVYTYDTEPGVGWSKRRIYNMYGCNAGSISYFSPDGSCVVVSGYYSYPPEQRLKECHVIRLEDATLVPECRFPYTGEMPWDCRLWTDYTMPKNS